MKLCRWRGRTVLRNSKKINHFTHNDNDAYAGHPNRRNVFGYIISETLYDIAGSCESDIVDLTVIRKYHLLNHCDTDCFVPKVIKWPKLDCAR